MKVTEEQRRALFERVREHLDEDTATLLLEVTVPANVDLATRADIQELRAEMLWNFTQFEGRLTGRMTELDGRMTSLEGRMTSLEGRLTERITELDGRLTAQITELDGRLTAQITELDGRLTAQITQLDGRLTAQITELDGRVAGLTAQVHAVGADLKNLIVFRILPAIAAMLALTSWLNRLIG